MNEATVTLNLPPAVYDALEQRAHRHHRRLEDEAALTLGAAVSADGLPEDLERGIRALTLLDNAALWRVSQSQPTVEDGILLDALVDQRRRQGLSPEEEALLAELVDRHDRVMVLRAEAVALLKERGVDVQERVAHA
jgi:plasmid stability protein